jgi:hypothetical protein
MTDKIHDKDNMFYVYFKYIIDIIRNTRFKILIPQFNKLLYTGYWIKYVNNKEGFCKIIHSTEKESIEKIKNMDGEFFTLKVFIFKKSDWVSIKKEELFLP